MLSFPVRQMSFKYVFESDKSTDHNNYISQNDNFYVLFIVCLLYISTVLPAAVNFNLMFKYFQLNSNCHKVLVYILLCLNCTNEQTKQVRCFQLLLYVSS